ncbi:MAG: transglutaminase domain-containing protein, partial [Clostridia bacterium]|nr:transglutaminase domain-containing protein [Clostridia bacterium]
GAYKEGVCRHFASAATLLYRALGIPARYTVGFMTDVKGGEITAVKGEDAHAWVEVYEDGFGWRYVEVTGSPAQDDPDLPPETDTSPGTGEDTEPVVEPSTWGDVVAGVNGQFGLSASVPPAVLNDTVFRVTAEDSVRHFLKLKSFGDYTGQGWLSAEDYPLLYLSTYSPSYLGGSVIWATGEASRHMTVVSPMGTVGIPYYISPETSGAGIQVGDNRMTGNGKTPYDVYYFPYADVTALDAQSFKHRDALLAYSAQLEEYVRENYTYLDDETRAYMDAIVEEQGWDPKDLRLADKVAAYADKVAAYVKGAADYREDYDKALNTEDNVVAAFLFEYGEGSSRHFAAAATLLFRAMGIPARYTVGYIADTVAGETVAVKGTDAYAWVEIYREGFGWVAMDVTPAGDYRPTVTLRPVTVRQKHNGTTLHASNVLTGFEEYEKQGYTYEAVVSGSLSVLGSAQSVIRSVELFDSQGNNVTDDFRIQLEKGVIFVYEAALTFGTDDYSKVYDGKPLTLTEEEVRLLEADTHNGKLPANLQYVVVPLVEPRDVGTGVLAFDVKIMYKKYDAQDTLTDQTEDYYIRRIYGRYTISPAEITLKAVDAQKTYDGTPLTAQGIEVAGGMLADGDYIAEYTVEGSRTRVGRSDNVITGVVIRNADGEDVTHNYAIETVVGTLRVTSP